MKHFTFCTAVLLSSGCATGYGTLAGMGVGMIIGGAAAIDNGDSRYVGQGAALGALIGVAAAGTASLVAHHSGKQEAREEARLEAQRATEAKERDENRKVLEAIRRERAQAGRLSPQHDQDEPFAQQAEAEQEAAMDDGTRPQHTK